MTAIRLPYPPSVNRLYRAVGGRSIMSAEYRAWKQEAGLLLASQRPQKHKGPVRLQVELTPPDKRRRDLDNASTKAVVDLLVTHGVIEGDDGRFVREITARWIDGGQPCVVYVNGV